jgi:predicted AAA+ superfamily ATPase
MRKEIAKSFKIYFWDLGLRNSLIQNFNSLDLRSDIGNMWENFCIAERIKKNSYARRFINSYFWRTYNKKEIDYIEEIDGKLSAFEFKLQETKVKPPKDFLESYSNSTFEVITKDNYRPFLM